MGKGKAVDRGARRAPLFPWIFAWILASAVLPARAQEEPGDELSPPADTDAVEAGGSVEPPAYATWRWRRVFSHPRIGGRLTAVAVDPTDPTRVVAGSEEGTVFQSFDGGATWEERPLYPFVTIDRSRPRDTGPPSARGRHPAVPAAARLPTLPSAGRDPQRALRGILRDDAPAVRAASAERGARRR